MTFLGLDLISWIAINIAIYLALAVFLTIVATKGENP